MYDKDGSGSIDMEEMLDIVATFYDMEGRPRYAKMGEKNKNHA